MGNFQRRKSLRHKDHNYSSPGFYFITICAFEKQQIFGCITDAKMALNEIGEVIGGCWKALPDSFNDIHLDTFIVMPNHFHALIQILGYGTSDLIQVIRNFKSTSSRKIRNTHPNLNIWQKSFYDRVVRTERELNLIRLYIDLNPMMWDETKKLSEIDFRSEGDLAKMLEPYRKL